MNLINVSSWSARKLHLADPSKREQHTWGSWLPALCDAPSVEPGGRWVKSFAVTQDRIDALEPCKKCAKKRDAMIGDSE